METIAFVRTIHFAGILVPPAILAFQTVIARPAWQKEISVADMAIFHLSIRPISRAKGQSAVAQVAYDTRGKLTNKRTDEKHHWSKHKNDLIEWQIIGPPCHLAVLAARAEQVGMHEWPSDGCGLSA